MLRSLLLTVCGAVFAALTFPASAQTGADTTATSLPGIIRVRSAESLLDQEVVDVEGDEIGEVEYLLIDVASGEVRFLIVDTAGLFDDDQYLALPWIRVEAGRRDEISVDVTEESLQQAPRFTEEGIESLVEQSTLSRLDTYYGIFAKDVPTGGQVIGAPLPEELGPEDADTANRGVVDVTPDTEERASTRPQILVQPDLLTVLMPPDTSALDDLTGAPVIREGADEALGEVDQLMLDTQRAQVAYALIARGGFLGIGQQWVPVPFESLRWSSERQAFTIDASEVQLQDMINVTRTDEFVRVPTRDLINLYERFDLRPYWERSGDDGGAGVAGASAQGG